MISIVIVNWNSGAYLGKCVASLREHAPEAQVIVVDNASSDGSLEAALDRAPATVVVRHSENRGFAAACNAGWTMGSGDPVLFLNPDTESTPGSVQALARTLEENPSASAAGGRLVDASGATQVGFNARRFPTLSDAAAEALLLYRVWPRNPWSRRYRMLDWGHSTRAVVDQPAGACLMVRRGVLERLHGFDETFLPAWFEDVDLCRRMRDLGGKILFEPDAHFAHAGGASLARLEPGEFVEIFHRNQVRYFYKHHGPGAARRVRRLAVAGIRLRALLTFFRPRTAAGYWRAARRIGSARGDER